MQFFPRLLATCLIVTASFVVLISDGNAAEPDYEFFEAKIRPVLIEHCYHCHNSVDTAEAELAVDHRQPLLSDDSGSPLIVPGQPQKSRLLAILRHEVEGLEMPSDGPQLDASVIQDFETWIAAGAPDPRDKPPSAEEVAAATSWDVQFERRQQWWSLQPLQQQPNVPAADSAASSSDHPVDHFLQAKLRQAGLTSAPPASPAVLVRRLYFTVIGLPPTADEAEHWTDRLTSVDDAERSAVISQLIDELLASPRFGERWARHWMDWIRYAESHGSEGDPRIDNAWYYRDYLIRALNADVSVDQLIQEHIAGDLLPHPRTNPELGINESAIGPAHWRMVFHGFAPTDALDERVRFTDDQINSVSKAFLGLTVSCARCHNHKFDAISQADYYALFGVLEACRPGRTVIDLPERVNHNRDELQNLKPAIRAALATDWLNAVQDLPPARLTQLAAAAAEADRPESIWYPLHLLQAAEQNQADVAGAWQQAQQTFQQRQQQWQQFTQADNTTADSADRHWNLAKSDDYAAWHAEGAGLPQQPDPAGTFAIAAEGQQALTGVYPAGVYSHSLSTKHPARLASADVKLANNSQLWVLACGDGQAGLRYVVQDYPRNGTVYPEKKLSADWTWQQFDLSYWKGDAVHVELTAARDAPLLVGEPARSWLGIRQAAIVPADSPRPMNSVEHLAPLFAAAEATPPQTAAELASAYRTAVVDAIHAWNSESLSDAQALLLDQCLRQQLLPNQLASLNTARPLLQRYRELEQQIPVPTRVPGLDETQGQDHPLFVRGDHRQPGELVPRRFLEAIDATPYEDPGSGRRELAQNLIRDDNPLTRRVLVNRVWHHVFGQGLVTTPDNFGRLGSEPSHPELLDWLALEFDQDGWSLKQLIRLLLTTDVWQQSAEVSEQAQILDPENRLLSHAHVRRLEAEAIRDTLLTVSGQIRHDLGGEPVAGNVPRRSVYVAVIRNSLDPFLRTFDFPEPFSSVGRRDVTNVPAQSLLLLNNPEVSEYARQWASRVVADDPADDPSARIQQMFLTALCRPATAAELQKAKQYLFDSEQVLIQRQRQQQQLQVRIETLEADIRRLTAPVRQRLQQQGTASQASQTVLPDPLVSWQFSDMQQVPDGLQLHSSARLQDSALLVRDGGYAVSQPLSQLGLQEPLTAKTLEAWVQLDQLQQRGGGVVSVQSGSGEIFDAIVFGERDPQEWLAGSNNFKRTEPFRGPREDVADSQPVHLAITWQADGTITGYRNGQPYGQSYQSSGAQQFAPANTVIGLGVRHLPASGNRLLSGRILAVRVYDKALTAAEVAASNAGQTAFISQQRIREAMTPEELAAVRQLETELASVSTRLTELGAVPETVDDAVVLAELARAMFTFKELIYVR